MGCGVERDIKAGLKNSSDVFGENRERKEVSQKSRIFDLTSFLNVDLVGGLWSK